MPEIMANTNHGKYPILIRTGALAQLGEVAAKTVRSRKAFIVTDETVKGLYYDASEKSLKASGFEVASFTVPAGESSKCEKNLFAIYDAMHEFGMSRSDLVIALGGGVVGDLTGFAAATYMRGCHLIQVPTTLLAQVDSSIGGKTGIDMPYGKNLVGAFYQPNAVVIDPGLLKSLSRTRMAEGMAEVIKYGCIRDAMLFEAIEKGQADMEWMLARCVKIKTTVVQNDEYDTGERMLLNFGHTWGHAIEKVSGYTRYTHGEAVAIGMVKAVELGEKLGETPKGIKERLLNVLEKWHLPTSTDLPVEDLYKTMLSDKKKLNGKVYYVVIKEIGDAKTWPLSEQELHDLL